MSCIQLFGASQMHTTDAEHKTQATNKWLLQSTRQKPQTNKTAISIGFAMIRGKLDLGLVILSMAVTSIKYKDCLGSSIPERTTVKANYTLYYEVSM